MKRRPTVYSQAMKTCAPSTTAFILAALFATLFATLAVANPALERSAILRVVFVRQRVPVARIFNPGEGTETVILFVRVEVKNHRESASKVCHFKGLPSISTVSYEALLARIENPCYAARGTFIPPRHALAAHNDLQSALAADGGGRNGTERNKAERSAKRATHPGKSRNAPPTSLPENNAGETKPLERLEFTERHMGVPVHITLYARDKSAAEKASRAAFDRIAELNAIFSDYDPDSEAMRLCRTSGPDKPVKVSPELLHVLVESRKLSESTDGAFDVTVGPVVRLWRRARRRKELPDEQRLAAARELVGWKNIKIDEKAGTVELKKSGMRLDFGGIAKGYAGDEALRILKKHGVARAMIDAGGDVVAGEPPPGAKGWKIGIAPLEKPEGPPSRFLYLNNRAAATSGDAFQYVEIKGVRYSHIVNPKTGLGLTTRSSVTITAPTGLTADSLASAVSVLGPTNGLKFVRHLDGVEAFLVTQVDGHVRAVSSGKSVEKDRLNR